MSPVKLFLLSGMSATATAGTVGPHRMEKQRSGIAGNWKEQPAQDISMSTHENVIWNFH